MDYESRLGVDEIDRDGELPFRAWLWKRGKDRLADWQPFRRALRVQYHDGFDQLFDDARQFADAAGIQNEMTVMVPFLVSVLLAQEHRIHKLEEDVSIQ